MSSEELARLMQAHGAALDRALPRSCAYAIVVSDSADGNRMHVYCEHDVAPELIVEFLEEAIKTLARPDRITGGQ
jgi:hypothetical protein